MGNHHSHGGASHTSSADEKSGEVSGGTTPRGGSRRDISRTSSAADIQEKSPSMVSIEKLAKILCQRSQKEDGVNGVTEDSIVKYVFPAYPELARQLFRYVHHAARARNSHVPAAAFRTQAERILLALDDAVVIEIYVRMFCDPENDNSILPDGLRSLLMTCYKLSMDHYPEGPQTCLMIHNTLSAVVDACFNNKDAHSIGFVVRWLEEHCHRLIFPVHRYVVHVLATRHRDVEQSTDSDGGGGAGLDLATPVLEKAGLGAGGRCGNLMPVSVAWLLAGTLPPLYSRPTTSPPPGPPSAGSKMASVQFLQRLVCVVPSHWVLLYDSREHGLGANRFMHHVLSYRGPTLSLVKCAGGLFVVGSSQEWRESHLYWGGADSVLLQVFPKFSIVEHAAKMLYLNTSIRGYPKGLRAGSDPRKPLLSVDEGFDKLSFKGIPYNLECIEVWGCGDPASRETQLEIKKWQVNEAERQRHVKLSAADWIDHPDRYLLELAGRPQYTDRAS